MVCVVPSKTIVMAAVPLPSPEKLEEGHSFHTTIDPSDLGGSNVEDCKAVLDGSASQRQWQNLKVLRSCRSRARPSWRKWRAGMQIKKSDHNPDIREKRTRRRETSLALDQL